MNRLHVDSVVKSFGRRSILSDIFISCGKGEIVGLLGRNGCGKSTLLKIIFGSLKAENRFVKVDDTYVSGLHDGYRYIQYLPQDGFLPAHIKIRTIIEMFCSGENATAVSEHPRIKPFLDKKRNSISGGERRFLEVLLLLYSDAPFVLIDEPFNGMSPLYVDEIKGLLKQQSAHKGFIVTDHSYRNILDISTRVVLMDEGAIRNISGVDDLRYWGYIR